MRNVQSGFSLLEVMAAVATVGILSAVVIPSFLQSKPKAQTADAQAELAKIEAAAKNYYLAEGKFPGSTVTMLPGPNGAACASAGKKFPVTSLWSSDPVWESLDFHVDQASAWTYHFETTGPTTARIRAVGDPDCDGQVTSIQVDLTAEIAMDDENDGSDSSGQVAHNWSTQTPAEAGVYPGSSSTVSSPGGFNNLGSTSSSTGTGSSAGGMPSAGSVATSSGTTAGTTAGTSSTNTVASTTTVSGACNWGNGNGQGQGCINGVANGDTNNTGNDKGHSNVNTTTTTTTTSTSGGTSTTSTTTTTSTGTVAGGTVNTSNGNGNNGNGNGNGNGKK